MSNLDKAYMDIEKMVLKVEIGFVQCTFIITLIFYSINFKIE